MQKYIDKHTIWLVTRLRTLFLLNTKSALSFLKSVL